MIRCAQLTDRCVMGVASKIKLHVFVAEREVRSGAYPGRSCPDCERPLLVRSPTSAAVYARRLTGQPGGGAGVGGGAAGCGGGAGAASSRLSRSLGGVPKVSRTR